MTSRLLRRLSAAVALATVFAVLPFRASADDTKKLKLTVVEDFWFLGCPDGIDPNLVDTCGTAQASRFGHGVVGTVITAFSRLPSGCFHDEHTTTIDFENGRGSLTVAIAGTLCPTGGRNFSLDGSYTVEGGTGVFEGAGGSGAVWAARDNGPITSEFEGTIVMDDER